SGPRARIATLCRNAVDTAILRAGDRPAYYSFRDADREQPRPRCLPQCHQRCDTAWMTGLSLALVNLKPGTGKTTSAVWLAPASAPAGNAVLLAAADPPGSALAWPDLAAMYPGLPPQAAFPFRIVALPSRELHRERERRLRRQPRVHCRQVRPLKGA